MDLPEAVASSRRDGLVALRDKLAATIDGSSDARSLAQLAKQLADVMRELEALPEVREATPLDDLASRRKARRSTSAAG